MNILVNNRPTEFQENKFSVQDLLKKMTYTFPMIVVKINGKLIKKEDYSTTFVKDGDKVEAIHLISGG